MTTTDPTAIRYEKGSDGIVVLTLDDPSKSTNTANEAYRDSMDLVLQMIADDRASIVGIIVTSAKKSFFAGGDLHTLVRATRDDAEFLFARADRTKGQLRKLETLGLPVVAVINGSALGGGAELALACHHRVVLDDPSIRLGFPEVTLGLLPGGGGIVRSTRLLGLYPALNELLLRGQQIGPAKALELGLVDETASDLDSLFAIARAWILSHPDVQQPWDTKGFTFPGGDGRSPQITGEIPNWTAGLCKRLKGSPQIAPLRILSAAVEGSIVDIATAMTIETRYFIDLVTSQISKNMIQGSFLDRQAIRKGGSRSQGLERTTLASVGIIGAGRMGAGIAYSCARNGVEVVLSDTSCEAAAEGKAYSAKVLDREVAQTGLSEATRDAVLARINTTDTVADMSGCDLVIEAVFENSDLKRTVLSEVQSVLGPSAILASNTSTLPITELSEGVERSDQFIGLHFFSPVDRMGLVEVIRGEHTSDATVVKAMDFVLQIRKTPILVNDSRGFFTSRVFGKFTREGVAMLADGVPAASIEQASSQAGYPVPVLQLVDELTLTLPKKIREEAIAAAAAASEEWVPHPSEPVFDKMVDEFGRTGRGGGAGFYDYENDKRVGLWPGLVEAFGPVDPEVVPFPDLIDRLLFSEVVETTRCFVEGVITSVADANVGSLDGISFPTWTGGVVQFIDGFPGGVTGFVGRAQELADRYGARFTPPVELVEIAKSGERASDALSQIRR